MKKHPGFTIPIDPREPRIDHKPDGEFKDEFGIYANTDIDKRPNIEAMPGSEMSQTAFVDADLGLPRSTTGFIIFWGSTLWTSKRQKTVAKSSQASEFTAIATLVQRLVDVRYTLRSFGAAVSAPARVFEDNMAVVHGTTLEKTAEGEAQPVQFSHGAGSPSRGSPDRCARTNREQHC